MAPSTSQLFQSFGWMTVFFVLKFLPDYPYQNIIYGLPTVSGHFTNFLFYFRIYPPYGDLAHDSLLTSL